MVLLKTTIHFGVQGALKVALELEMNCLLLKFLIASHLCSGEGSGSWSSVCV